MAIPHPLPDGLYWYRDDSGAWEPMYVCNGQQFKLVVAVQDADAQMVSDFAAVVAGPLVRPT